MWWTRIELSQLILYTQVLKMSPGVLASLEVKHVEVFALSSAAEMTSDFYNKYQLYWFHRSIIYWLTITDRHKPTVELNWTTFL